MTNVFAIWKTEAGADICMRDLRPGMRIPMMVEISAVTVMNGRNGEPPTIIADGHPSAMAIKIEFSSIQPIIAHPATVALNRKSRPILQRVIARLRRPVDA